VFEQYAAILHQKYPEISVEGDMYPPPDYKVMLARAMVCDQICIHLFYMYLNSFIHSFIFHFIHLQVQPKDVEIVIICCTIYLLNYRCQMTEYNYNTMIT